MNTNKTIGIIGCGWLGWPLAKQLLIDGYDIHGSTTSVSKFDALRADGISPFLIELLDDTISGDIEAFLSHCEFLIVNIPPKLRQENEAYVPKMKLLVSYIEQSSVSKVLFIGSTSVYNDSFPFSEITELSETSSSDKARQLILVEQLFQNSSRFETTVLRFSGLFGDDRHPAYYLSGRTNIKNPDAPVNLIHRTDCIEIIRMILKLQLWNELLNASSIPHPSRNVYYTEVCKTKQLPLPEFDHTETSKGKIINSEKLIRLLNYEFQVKL